MPRIDKYDPNVGNFRAPLAADRNATRAGDAVAVGLDVNGRVVPGAGNTGILGVLTITRNMQAGEIVDVMTHGELVDMVGLTAGTLITADVVTGVLATTAPGAGRKRIGWTVEATRLIVHVPNAAAGA